MGISKARAFRKKFRTKRPIVTIGVYDGLSAKIAESVGFDAFG